MNTAQQVYVFVSGFSMYMLGYWMGCRTKRKAS